MSKRTATEIHEASQNESKKSFRAEPTNAVDEGIGEFEDGWEDEFESDEEVVDAQGEDGMLV